MAALTNFAFLAEHDSQLVRFGMLAERYFPEDPNTCLIKLRQLTELPAQLVASRTGLFVSAEEGNSSSCAVCSSAASCHAKSPISSTR
jgi:hypothetical protein